MKNNQGFVVPVLLLIIVILAISFGMYVYKTNHAIAPEIKNETNEPEQVSINGNCGLIVTSVKPNSQTSFPLTISGVVDNTNREKLRCSWQMFEGQLGTASLFYRSNEGWKELGQMVPVPVADWMTTKTTFSVSLNFNNEGLGLTPGTQMKVLFTEENASGLPPVDVYELPLILK